MLRKFLLTGIWLAFVAYTVGLAPLDQPDTWPIVRRLLTLQWGELNAYLVAIFCLMGVWPLIYGCLMAVDGQTQGIRAWPYFLGSNGTGVLCLMPYLILRRPNQQVGGHRDRILNWLEAKSTAIGLLLSGVGLVLYALLLGDWADFVHQWQTHPFVHLIAIDFCLMALIFPLTSLAEDDIGRRGIQDRRVFWLTALVPLMGPLVYLCLRPPLPQRPERMALPQ